MNVYCRKDKYPVDFMDQNEFDDDDEFDDDCIYDPSEDGEELDWERYTDEGKKLEKKEKEKMLELEYDYSNYDYSYFEYEFEILTYNQKINKNNS
ncbi:MAG: hypothetical protein KQ78_00036 [Candidatus Izimaplasma bacterium HR2]|nr:MAG: hypothetical protein KQ78_00036 [Candidatus Izimaplasma bacterium HR2]